MNLKYVIKKIIASLVTLVLLATVTFFIFEIIPGDVVIAKLGTNATKESIEAMREAYGLDKSVLVRYGEFMSGMLSGDFGVAYSTGFPAGEMVAQVIPRTATLAMLSLVLVLLVSVPVGMFVGSKSSSGQHRRKVFAFDVLNQTCMSLPPFVVGIVISIFFGLTLNWFVPGQMATEEDGTFAVIMSYMPAAVSVAIPKIAMMIRFIKTSVAEEMNKNYVRLAKSKGMSNGRILFGHVLKNVVITNITALSVIIVEIFAGSVVIEQVFSINGMGRLLVSCINVRDFRVVSILVVYIGIVVIVTNLAADILYAVVDKRTVKDYE